MAVLVGVALAVESLFAVRITTAHRRPPITQDAALFQHAGWYLAHGGRLYTDVWDLKPPLTFEITAGVSLLVGGDPYWLHLLSVAAMMLSVCGIVVLIGLLTHHLTDDVHASLLAGVSMFLLAGFAVRPAYGFKSKYPMLLCGLLALYLFVSDRQTGAGVSAAASVGFWQLGAVFPLLLVGLALDRRDWQGLGRVAAGGLVTSVLMFSPVLLWGSTSEMLVQTVLVPLSLPEETPFSMRLFGLAFHYKYAAPLVALGTYGLVRFGWSSAGRDAWWVLAGAGWFWVVVLFIDFEIGGYTDLIPLTAFVAIGIGLLVASLDTPLLSRTVVAVVLAVCVLNVALLGSLGLVFKPVRTSGPVPMSDLRAGDDADATAVAGARADVRYLYWNQLEPRGCHYRLSGMERDWLDRVDASVSDPCFDLVTARSRLRPAPATLRSNVVVAG